MPQINVARRFALNLGHDTLPLTFEPGLHTVSDEIANHWFVKGNLVDEDDPVAVERRAADAANETEAHGRSVANLEVERLRAQLAEQTARAERAEAVLSGPPAA